MARKCGILMGFFCLFFFFRCKENVVVIHKTGFSDKQEEKAETERLVNDALDQVIFDINNDFMYINVFESSIVVRPITSKDIRYKYDQELLSKYNFRSDIFSDSTDLNWKDYNIDKVKLFTRETVPYGMYNSRKDTLIYQEVPQNILDSLNKVTFLHFYTKVEKGWSRERVDESVAKARKKYEDDFPLEDHFLHYISKPLFSRDKKYAIITINKEVTGSSYVFKKVKNKWVLAQSFRSWIR